MTALFKRVLDIMSLISAVVTGPVAFAFLVFSWGFDKIASVSGDFLTVIAGFALPGAQFDLETSVFIPLSRINAFIPLSENWVFMLAYLTLAANVTTFRFIKSLIPTMGN